MNRPARIDPKRATNVSLPASLVEQAKALGVNLSQACEQGLDAEVRKAMSEQWQRDNRAAVESSNDYVRKHGLPLVKYRAFHPEK